ncbi:hypothetical protein CSB09_01825 [Candidatus Gracilibacteria bacterium]|nr:MAG: hypothetical protein CSB09_01825 [Candidatus Gracilibacteria bacterium]
MFSFEILNQIQSLLGGLIWGRQEPREPQKHGSLVKPGMTEIEKTTIMRHSCVGRNPFGEKKELWEIQKKKILKRVQDDRNRRDNRNENPPARFTRFPPLQRGL